MTRVVGNSAFLDPPCPTTFFTNSPNKAHAFPTRHPQRSNHLRIPEEALQWNLPRTSTDVTRQHPRAFTDITNSLVAPVHTQRRIITTPRRWRHNHKRRKPVNTYERHQNSSTWFFFFSLFLSFLDLWPLAWWMSNILSRCLVFHCREKDLDLLDLPTKEGMGPVRLDLVLPILAPTVAELCSVVAGSRHEFPRWKQSAWWSRTSRMRTFLLSKIPCGYGSGKSRTREK
mmetsp:Transcript_3908/g.7496  ORF Transcript_3908/g.7496 Transcript_3908/m.7496 type:complete len:229 (-) Transcript_3908:1450-2136(-)